MKLHKSNTLLEHTNSVFEHWKKIIEREIPDSRVEHIGSTAIRGVLTKGDIDLYVEVPAINHADTIATLETMGFRIKADTHRDDELCMLESISVSGLAIQVVTCGSKYEFFLTFRDRLNANPALVEQYNTLKTDAIYFSDDKYRIAKSQFINKVLYEPR
jgi:GrpB-like predicted nucleotidyltransferase (UPF0157 family)